MNIKIEVREIKKSYNGLDTIENISLVLKESRIVSIIGPSGCGKTTLFEIISGLDKPDRGTVFIDGEEFTGRTGRVSYMRQKDLLFPWMTILDNVSLPKILKGEEKEGAKKDALKFFEVFGLKGFENYYPNQLSGGMKQRAAFLRSYLFSSDIMLLDEPFGGLDAITRRKMQLWLQELIYKFKSSILFITHSVDEAIFLSDEIYVLSRRPATVVEVLEIKLKKPRDINVFSSAEFIKIKEEILTKLNI
ncbi:MAG: ABC transporter ATP-binding protein [Actinomycetota bacterium]|nr:ABC transporter ATP-binding protein [Actinomycetota bacterium]